MADAIEEMQPTRTPLHPRYADTFPLLTAAEPGVFAIGDARAGPVTRVGGAIGDGAAVVAQVHAALTAGGAAAG